MSDDLIRMVAHLQPGTVVPGLPSAGFATLLAQTFGHWFLITITGRGLMAIPTVLMHWPFQVGHLLCQGATCCVKLLTRSHKSNTKSTTRSGSDAQSPNNSSRDQGAGWCAMRAHLHPKSG